MLRDENVRNGNEYVGGGGIPVAVTVVGVLGLGVPWRSVVFIAVLEESVY